MNALPDRATSTLSVKHNELELARASASTSVLVAVCSAKKVGTKKGDA
jgi:hypothetical protein